MQRLLLDELRTFSLSSPWKQAPFFLVQQEAVPRRLKSAPLLRSNPSTTILAIPEPRLLVAAVPTTTTIIQAVPPRARASSAKARLNTALIDEKPPARREIRSAHRPRRKDSTSLSEEEIQQIFQRVYGNTVATAAPPSPAQPAVQVIYTQPAETLSQPPPVYVYKKSSSWTPVTITTTNQATDIDVTAIPLNPHYIHRPGVIAIRNQEKRSLIRASSAPRRQHRKRAEPLRAFAPVATKNKVTLEIDGMKLTYDPELTLEDRSSNLTKYFVDGRLYLIKNQRYNIIDHVEQASIDKYNRHLTWDSLHSFTDLWCSCTLLVGLLNGPSTLNWCIERTRSVTSSTTIWTLTKCLWEKGRLAAMFLHRINNRTYNIVSLPACLPVCVLQARVSFFRMRMCMFASVIPLHIFFLGGAEHDRVLLQFAPIDDFHPSIKREILYYQKRGREKDELDENKYYHMRHRCVKYDHIYSRNSVYFLTHCSAPL